MKIRVKIFSVPTALLGLRFASLALLLPAQLHAQSGSVDPTFNPGAGADLFIYTVLVTNNNIYIGGDFTRFDDVERVNIARLNADGARDDTYTPSADAFGGAFPYVNTMAVQTGGKLLVGGSFTNTAGTNLSRLLVIGALDTNFNVAVDDTINALALQTDGSILFGGFFTHVNGQPRTGIARTDSDGILDSTFNPSISGGFSTVYAVAVQTDGKILIGGSFTNVDGSTRTNIARLNSDGSLDTNFTAVAVGGGQLSPASFYALALDAQGKVIVGGDFTSVNGQVRTNLARFNTDGSLDLTFSPVAGTDYAVNSIVLENYGRILLAGYFNTVNGVTNNYIARLNIDGSLDSTFNTGTGASDVVYSVALQPDGKVLIGGAFTEVNSALLSGIARLQNVQTVPPPRLVNPGFSNTVFRVSVATFSGKSYVLEYKNLVSDPAWTALPGVSGDGTVKVLSDMSATGPRRFYRVEVQ